MMAVVPGYSSEGTDRHIVAMLGYIAANYSKVTLRELAEFFSYNESYISRMLKRISRISQEVGCFDSSHLSKKFRKRYGLSPIEYREKINR